MLGQLTASWLALPEQLRLGAALTVSVPQKGSDAMLLTVSPPHVTLVAVGIYVAAALSVPAAGTLLPQFTVAVPPPEHSSVGLLGAVCPVNMVLSPPAQVQEVAAWTADCLHENLTLALALGTVILSVPFEAQTGLMLGGLLPLV
jgi:hypothetical protein